MGTNTNRLIHFKMENRPSTFLSWLPGQKQDKHFAACRNAWTILLVMALITPSITANGARLFQHSICADVGEDLEQAPARQQNLNISHDIGLGGEKTTLQEGYTIYPNPAGRILYVRMSKFPENPFELEILDITGKQVFKYHPEGAQDILIQISLENLRPGMYFLRIYSEKTFKTFRFIVQ
jgi:hypothetical protein